MKVFYSEHSSHPFVDRCIWTNGCYDILHIGHLRLFEKCRKMADEMKCPFFVGIDSDKRVRELKGESRPFNAEDIRAESLLSIRGIDRVFVYDTADQLNSIIKTLSPEVMIIGDDYRNRPVVGAEHTKTIEFFPKVEGYSTTETLTKMSSEQL